MRAKIFGMSYSDSFGCVNAQDPQDHTILSLIVGVLNFKVHKYLRASTGPRCQHLRLSAVLRKPKKKNGNKMTEIK
jgi:hypothetical protein